MQPPNGHPPQPVASVEIVMMSDGNIQSRAGAPNRQVLLMMLETAKFDLERKFHQMEQEQGKVQLPPAGIDLSALRGGL